MRVHTVSGTAVRTSARTRRRIAWLMTTALVGTFGAGAVNAELPGNYSIPVNNVPATNPVVTVVDVDAILPNIVVNAGQIPSTSYETMGIQLNRATTVMNWGTFNLTNSAEGNPSAINFTSTVGAASVLNRVAAGNPSTILGTISAPNVAVWLINTSGITVGAGGNFSGASLVLSASDIAPADFGTASMNLTGVDTAAPINLTGAGNFTATNSIVVVGQQITANKTMSAIGGDVALIAARDVTLPFALGSPLGITITKGTNLGTASIDANGAISAQSVRIVGASEGGAIASLLNVGAAGTLIANAANGVVVLATTSDAATGISITGAAGNDGITVGGGGLGATGATADIAIRASGAAALNTAATANDRVDISGRSVSVNATSISLNTAVSSAGDVSIESTTSNVRLDSASATGGNLSVTSAGVLTGRTVPGPVALSATGAGTNSVTVLAAGDASLGAITADDAISITAATIGTVAATNVTAGTSLTLNQTVGDLAFPAAGAYTWGTDLSLTAAQDLVLTAPVLSPGNAALNAGRDVIGTSVTTTNGSISIIAGRNISGPAATRIAVTAGGAGRTIGILGTSGLALLGTVSSAGASTVSNASVDIESANIVLTGATSTNGTLRLAATAGGVEINTASATGGDLTISATTFVRGRAAGTGANLQTVGPAFDVTVGSVGATTLDSVDSTGKIATTSDTITIGSATADLDIIIDNVGLTANIGILTAGGSIAARSGGSLTGGTLQAGEDIALAAGTTVDFGSSALTAGDDIDIAAFAALTAGVLTANGTGPDTRRVDLAGATIVIGAETPDHQAANIRARSATGTVALGGTNTNFTGGGDIAIDGATSVALTGAHQSRRSLAVLARGASISSTGDISAREDVALQAAGAVGITNIFAGDDISVSGATITLTQARTDATGSDTRTVNLAGPAINFDAGELPATIGSDINATATLNDIVAGSLLGANDVTATANRDIRVDTVTASTGNVRLTATTGSVTGRLGATPGASDPTFGRAAVSAASGIRSVDINAAGLVQLGVVSAGNAITVAAGNAGANGAIDITSASTTNGSISLTARAVAPVVGARDGDIILGTGVSGGTATLTNTATGGTAGDVLITDSLTAFSDVVVQSSSDILINEFAGGTTGFIRSLIGGIALTAADSVFGLNGTATMPLERGFGVIDVGGNLNVNATGDARIDGLSAGGDLALNIGGSLTGRAPGSIGTAVTGGALFTTIGPVTITAGSNPGEVARLNTIESGGDIAISADGIAIGTVRSTGGTISTSGVPGGFYFGLISLPGSLNINLAGTPSAISSVTQSLVFDPGFGATNLSAGGSISSTFALGGIAQLGTVTAGTSVSLAARGIGATTVTATAGPLALTATEGTLAVGTVTSGATANLTKQLGDIATSGDEIRILTSLSSVGDATILSNTGVRIATLTSNAGDVSVTATNGDVSGLARTLPATDGRLLAGFDRANLTASAVDRTVTVSALGATAGNVQLGAVNAGTGLTTLAGDQITVDAGAIDIATATAFNGNLILTSNVGDVVLGSGTGGVDATISANASARIGDLTARTGKAYVTALTGDVSGLARTLAATDGRLLSGFDRANLTASAVDRTVTVSAIGAAGNAQLGTVNAGTGLTTLAGDQVTVTARAIDAMAATAFNGNLVLTSNVGDVVLGSGTGGVDATVSAAASARIGGLTARTRDLFVNAVNVDAILGIGRSGRNSTVTARENVRIGDLRATDGNVFMTATTGDVSGLARSLAATDGRLLTGFDRANLEAQGFNPNLTVSATGAAAGNVQLGSVVAGSGVTTLAVDQLVVTAQAIDISSAAAFMGNLRLTSLARDVVLGSGRGGVDAIITAASSARIGSLRAQTRDLFVDAVNVDAILVDGSSARNSTVTARENVRIGMLETFDGNVSVTATRGDVSGLVRTAAATDGRLLADFDGGIVTAGGIGRTTTVSALGLPATGGNVQLGIVRAGSGLMTLAADQVTVIAQAIDIGSATADNGNLVVISTARDVVIADGTGRANATVQTAGNARIGNLTGLTGDVLVTAATGDVSGLADAGAPLDGRPLPGFGRTNLTASDVGRTVTVSALDTTAGNVQLGTVNAGFGVTTLAGDQVIVNGQAIDVTSATALNGNLALTSLARDVVLGTGFAGVNANVQAAVNARIGDLTAQTGNISVTAATGDMSGLLLAIPTIDGRPLTGFGRANLTARGAGETLMIAALNGTVQLGAATAGAGNSGMVSDQITVTAQAIDITSTTAFNGDLFTNATMGALRLETGTVGGSARLTKNGLVDEVSVGNLLAGARNGGSGAVNIASDTNIRANFIFARGGDVVLRAIDGEVTGRSGARAYLTADFARDSGGNYILGSDRSIFVSSGRLSLLGPLLAGDAISVDAGIASAATRQGRIDLTTAQSSRGSVSLNSFNAVGGTPTDIVFDWVSARTFATMQTSGANGGDIRGNWVVAGNDILNAVRDVRVGEVNAGESIAVQAGRQIVGTTYTAGEDVFAIAADALSLGSALAGDDIDLNGSTITLGTAVARGNGPDTSSVDFALFPGLFVAERADRANANITIGSTSGDVTVTGPLSAQRNVTVSAATVANIDGTVTAGAPVNPGDSVILGNSSVTGGTGVNLGTGGFEIAHTATGAVTIRAIAGNVTNLAAALTIQANSDGVGTPVNGVVTEPLSVTATAGNIQLGNTTLVGGTLAGRESEIALTAANGAVTFARADGNALIIRAGGTVTATDAITAGNAARASDPVSGFNTVDIVSTGGSISVTTIDAIGTGHDIVLAANGGTLTADSLTANRNVTGTAGSVLVGIATATNGALGLTAGSGDVILGGGAAGGNATLLASQNVRVGSVLSGSGDVRVTATNGDVSGSARLLPATDGRLLAGFDRADLTASGVGRTITVSAVAGTAQLGALNAGTGTTTSVGDQIAVTARAIDVTTANAANGNLLMNATAGDVILVTGTSGVNATVRASSDVRVGDLTARTGDMSVTATTGEVSGLARTVAATDGRLLTGFDRANLTALAVDKTLTVSAVAGTVQLGAANAGTGNGTLAGDQIKVDAQAIDVTTANAANGNLLLTSTVGDVILGTGTGGVDAGVVAAGNARIGSLTARTRDLLVRAVAGDAILTTGNSGRNATVLANNNARIGDLTAAGGNVSVTATTGSVSGLARAGAATDGRLLTGFDRANLTAATAGQSVAVLANAGTVQLGTVNAGTGTTTSAGDQIAVNAQAIDITTANAANGNLSLTSTVGDVILGTGVGGVDAGVVAAANARIDSLTARTRDLSVRSVAGDTILTTGNSGRNATILANSDARIGDLAAANGNVSVTATTGDVSGLVRTSPATDGRLLGGFDRANLTSATAGLSVVVTANAGTVQLGAVNAGTGATTSAGDQIAVNAQAIDITTANAANGNLLLTSTVGDVILGTGTGGVDAGVMAAGNARIGSLTARTRDLSVRAVAGDAILTTGNSGRNAMVLANNNARIGDLTAAGGDISVTATTGNVSGLARAGAATDGRLLTGFERANLTASAAGETVLVSALTGTVQLGAVNAGTGGAGADAVQVGVGARAIDIASVTAANGRIALDATAGDVILGTSTSARATTIAARDVVRLGSVTASASPVTITASDAVLNGDITGSAITVVNRSPSTSNVFRLGNGVAGNGFSLDQTEINRLNAAAVTLDAGTGTGNTAQDIAIGELAFDTSTGSATIDILGIRRIDVTGTVKADGSAATRVIRFGGSTNASDKASVIRVAPLATTGGGRISMASANVELRGTKIGVGQDPAFLNALGLNTGGTPLDPAVVATDFINNPVSTLYSAANGGTPYSPLNQEIFAARTLTVKFTDYALFQNTGAPGTSGGAVLGGTLTSPLTGTILEITGPNPPDARGFAIFGSINGVTGQSTALLGGNTVSVLAVDRANTRINGCIVGSGGGGCLVNVITQPVLSVFDSSRTDIFQTAADFEIPFDPVVGTNNESLFGDVGTFGLDDIPIAPLPACDADKDPACTRTQD